MRMDPVKVLALAGLMAAPGCVGFVYERDATGSSSDVGIIGPADLVDDEPVADDIRESGSGSGGY